MSTRKVHYHPGKLRHRGDKVLCGRQWVDVQDSSDWRLVTCSHCIEAFYNMRKRHCPTDIDGEGRRTNQ